MKDFPGKNKRRCRRNTVVLHWLGLACLLLIGTPAWAADNCVSAGGNTMLALPATITVPRDVPVGTVLTPWVESPEVTNWYRCDLNNMGVTGQVTLPSETQMRVRANGGYFSVFGTAVAGVGAAIGLRQVSDGCGNDSWMIGVPLGIGGGGSALCSMDSTWQGGQVGIALVKTGPISAGTLAAQAVLTVRRINGKRQVDAISKPYIFSISAVTVSEPLCTTPDVQVDLGQHKLSELKGIATSTSATSFSIKLNNCPSGMASIQYRIDANTAADAQSVVSLNASSKAAGVGIQLLDDNGKPLPLGVRQTLAAYKKDSSGNFTIPLKARYYQTKSNVVPGTANTSLTFTMQYL